MAARFKYRARSLEMPNLYVSERWGKRLGKLSTIDDAIHRTKEYWDAHLPNDWQKHFTLERV